MPADKVSKKRRMQKTMDRLRREGRSQDDATLKKLEARQDQSEEALEQSTDLDDILDGMDIDLAGGPGSEQSNSQAGTESESRQATGSSDQQQGLTQQGSDSAQGRQPSGNGQGAIDQPQEQHNLAEQAAADGHAQDQQSNAQPSNAQQTSTNGQAQEQQSNAQQGNVRQTTPTIKKEPLDDASSLFVPETSVEEVPEYGPPLLRRPGSGTAGDKTTVGWTGQTGTKFINRYGKKSAARYRLEHFADNLYNEHDLPAEDNVSNQDNRLSDQKIGTKWKYTRRHMRSIYGVAWMSAGFEPSADDLELLNPDAARKRWVRTYILVAWEIPDKDGKLFVTMKWEPRSALRTRWGGKQADKAIYQAACEAEIRYEDATAGIRAAVDRTPSVGLNDDFMRHMREQSLAAAASSTPRPSGGASGKGVQEDLRVAFLRWRADYLMMIDVERFEDLSDKGKSDMIDLWALKKNSLLQAK